MRLQVELGTLKTHETRSVAVPGFVMNMVAPHLVGRRPEEFLFPARDGEPMKLPTPGNRWFAGAAARAGLDITPHGLRHVAAGLLIQSGANPKMVARQRGTQTRRSRSIGTQHFGRTAWMQWRRLWRRVFLMSWDCRGNRPVYPVYAG